MGGGSWTRASYNAYTTSSRSISLNDFENNTYSTREIYKANYLDDALNPYKVIRACHDNDEHPNTLPVIFALDVTGSMGGAAMKVRQKLDSIMTELYANDKIRDIEFCCMAIGDLYWDKTPIQITQFESDVRIAEQLDKVFFEAGGGGNKCESYSAAWYMGARHCDLDAWKRGKKGIIITLGDECPDEKLPKDALNSITGDHNQADISATEIYKEAKEKYNIYHISVDDPESSYHYHQMYDIDAKWKNRVGENNYFVANLDSLPGVIVNIIINAVEENEEIVTNTTNFTQQEVSW